MFATRTVAVVVAALVAQSALVSATECTRKYTVKEGDICDSISVANSVSTYQLAVVNSGRINLACSNLVPGDEICLGTKGEDCTTTYTVKKDDICDDISAAHGLNSTIFYHNNPQINQACDNLYIGEVLCVSTSVQVPPAPAGELPAVTIPVTATPAVTSSVYTSTFTRALPTTTTVVLPVSTFVTSTRAAVTPTSTFVTSTRAAVTPTSTPAPQEDEEDCDEEEEEETGNDGDNGDGDYEDDEDLPYCDKF